MATRSNTRPFATIILAGGKGTRMGSSDKHKVCFEVLGVPVIIRALETYNLCGSKLNVVVVGMMAENVMATVNRRFPGTVYAYQEKPQGTGDAARKGAQILERMEFKGDILVVAGDKVIAPGVIRHLLNAHRQTGADVTLATARRPPKSSTGILLKTDRGVIAGILEEAERQRLVALRQIEASLRNGSTVARAEVEEIVCSECSERTAQKVLAEIWRGPAGNSLAREAFEDQFSERERKGLVTLAGREVPAATVLERFNQMNLSTYVFRAPVLYDALGRLKSTRASQEEYLTDVFEILANRRQPARVLGHEVSDLRDLMAFNNPQELLAIEEVYRQKETPVTTLTAPPAELASTGSWLGMLRDPSPAAHRQLRQFYGKDVPAAKLQDAVAAFARRYGTERQVAVVRSPGRINLMGRHIDHQGGTVNVMAVDREILLVASPRTDDVVTLANADGAHFSEQTFRISDLIASLNWDDWEKVIDGPRIQRILEAARGDWANYVKAAILRLQEQFRDRQLRGLDVMVSGDIPMGAGLSSSSALVVAAAEVVRAFNRLPVSARRLVSLCGEGEWFVGTRGGAADHAAIKLSHRGCVTRVGFFPFEIQDSAPFFPGHDLIACNSGIYAGKSSQARNAFNAKVTAYHIGRIWFKMLRPELAERIEHLRDLNREYLKLSQKTFATMLNQLPLNLSRAAVQSAFRQMPAEDRERLERLFSTHEAPAGGYPVRGVVLFGLSEMARARECLPMLKANDARGLGRAMRISHDGDRVARETNLGMWRRRAKSIHELELMPGRSTLSEYAGDYGCSLPELDRIADVATRLPGVEGAQLAGAGLGGCIMVLVQKSSTNEVLEALRRQGITSEVFRPIAGASSLVLM